MARAEREELDSEPVVHNAANEKEVAAAGKKQSNRRRRELDDVRAVLALPAGRRFLWRLLGQCRVTESIFAPNSRIAYNSGMQDVGHFVQGEIVLARPEAYLQMITEHQESPS